MKQLFLCAVLFLDISRAYTQQSGCECSTEDDYISRLQAGLIGLEYTNPVKGSEGEQFWNNWTEGEVTLESGDRIRGILLRYDKYLDELLWLRDIDFKKGVINKSSVVGFRFSGSRSELAASFVKRRIKLPFADSTQAFLQVLATGEISLFAYRNVTQSVDDFRLLDNTRYLISGKGRDFWLVLNRKSLLDIPVIDKTRMKSVLRANHVALKDNEQELARALIQYNSGQ